MIIIDCIVLAAVTSLSTCFWNPNFSLIQRFAWIRASPGTTRSAARKLSHFNKTVSISKNFVAPQAAWINDEIQKDLAHRKELRLIAEKTNSPADWSTYKKARNRLRNKMRRTEEAYTKEYLNCQDEKTKWSRIKTYAGLEKMAGADMEMMTDFGKTKSGPILSSFMNSYFKQKVEKLKAKTQVNLEKALDYTKKYKSKNNALFEDEFAFKNVDLEHLLRHANNLTNTNAMGVDEIST